jgi:hypothetical protein
LIMTMTMTMTITMGANHGARLLRCLRYFSCTIIPNKPN